MSFRRKLLLVFTATVVIVVLGVAWAVSALARSVFDQINQERTSALVRQFQREFERRGDEVAQEIETIAASDASGRMALDLRRAEPDYSVHAGEAKTIAESRGLDFLEFVDSTGKIISSAQWPAKFGYKDTSLKFQGNVQRSFLKEEDLPQRAELGVFAIRVIPDTGQNLYVVGGKRLDRNFLQTLELAAGMRALLYSNVGAGFSTNRLIDPSGRQQDSQAIAPLIQKVLQDGAERTATIQWTGNRVEDESVHASPLLGQDGQVAAVLLVATSRRPYVELNRRVGEVALLAAGAGILLAGFITNWAAWLVTRPVDRLANAARALSRGESDIRVDVASGDELGELADAFNKMTRDLSEQSARLVQAERVAAWRELARRLAHELKNPLFPLQLTVENLVRAHEHNPAMFEEMFREGTTTLLAEITNLKSTIGRFSEFSKMPQPHFQQVDVNGLVSRVQRVFQAQLQAKPGVDCRLELEKNLPPIAADPDLLHRSLSNLVLNAMDELPDGGGITLATSRKAEDRVKIEVRDTGKGLTREECDRLFTPYYTTKQHGTGLGLAIVQSIISDHNGTVSVQSVPGQGSTFTIELPRNWDKLNAVQSKSATGVSQL